jgi:hypothetical protein
MTLKQNLIDRSNEIKFLIAKELHLLETPCSITDMVKRVGASRMPIEKHLKSLLSTEEFADISIVRVGGVDVIYRVVAKPKPTPVEGVEAIAGAKDIGDGELGRGREEGHA